MSEELLRRIDLMADLLETCLDLIATPPEANCSCHISPPCADCVNHSYERMIIRDIQTQLKWHQTLRLISPA